MYISIESTLIRYLNTCIQNSPFFKDIPESYTCDLRLEVPENPDHGDFSWNIALQLSKLLSSPPRKIAEQILATLPETELLAKIEIAGPGFINFFISNTAFLQGIKDLSSRGELIGKTDDLNGKVYLAEHTDPNLFKELHGGHLMTNTLGESLYRMFCFAGADVKNITFQGDVGLHIAKSLWGILNQNDPLPEDATPYEKQKFLGKCYVFGEQNFSESETAKAEIIALNKKIYTQEDEELNALYQKGSKWSLEYFESIYALLGSKFDHYFLESTTWKPGKKIVEEHIGTVFEKSDGAVVFRGSEHGFHDRVFINSEGLPTYEAKDIGLFSEKWKKYQPDFSLTVTGADQDQYFKTVREAGRMITPEWAEKTSHLAHGVLKLKSGKMSSRKGKIIRAQEWINGTKENILRNIEEREKQTIPESQKEETAERIAIAAIKYSVLKVSVGKDIVYDEATATDFTGNSGPYLQYSLVRGFSILRSLEEKPSTDALSPRVSDLPLFEKKLHHFSKIVERSRENLAPHFLATYLYDLCSEFNSFYAHTKIQDPQNPEYAYNITLIEVFTHVMKNGLWLLGIPVVHKM